MKRLTLLAAALAVGLGACGADNRTSIEILGRAAPSSESTCTFAAGGQYVLGNATYDVSLGGQYNIVLYVQNNLVDASTLNAADPKDANGWSVQAARVRVNPSNYTGQYGPSPALTSITGDSVLPVAASPIVEPAGGQGTIWLGLLSDDIMTALQSVDAGGQIVLGVTLQGVTNGGTRLDAGEFMYPIEVCVGCMSGTPICTTGTAQRNMCDGQADEIICQ